MQSMEEKPQLAAEGKDAASDEEIARRLQQQLNGGSCCSSQAPHQEAAHVLLTPGGPLLHRLCKQPSTPYSRGGQRLS